MVSRLRSKIIATKKNRFCLVLVDPYRNIIARKWGDLPEESQGLENA